MRRRSLLRSAAAGAFLGTAGITTTDTTLAAGDRIEPLLLDSTASLLDAAGEPLADADLVAVWAADTATNVDEDGDGDAVTYPAGTEIPLVASDGGVVGFGAPIVQDDTDFAAGNEEFVLNVLDAEVGGGTVVFDEGHGQYYDAAKHDQFIAYAESNDYDVSATTSLAADLASADAAIITSPASAFSESERSALSSFVNGGGALLLFHQSDFGNYDATDDLNAVAEAVGVGFRFNDDQVIDGETNGGIDFVPKTGRFNDAFDYFADRPGIEPPELSREASYEVDVTWVTDGDTVDVRFANGYEDTVRILGIDAPETNSANERSEEWEGIESYDVLRDLGYAAEDWAIGELGGETVSIRFDDEEPLRGDYGRLLAYVDYDRDGSGDYDTSYNRTAVSEGWARVYDSGFGRHDAFLREEFAAREAGRGVWAESAPDAPEVRDSPVDSVYFPKAVPVVGADEDGDRDGHDEHEGHEDRDHGDHHEDGERELDDDAVAAYASSSATTDGPTGEDGIPLAAVDEDAGVVAVGALLVDESYEAAEGYPVDTSGYGNFRFLRRLIEAHAEREGDVYIDGGHGQFDAEFGLSAEDAAYFLRYLEGQDTGFEGINDLDSDLLDDAKALVVSSPATRLSDAELDRLEGFTDDGGVVVLLGGAAPAAARANLNRVAAALDSSVRLGAGTVTDEKRNLNDDPTVPVTSRFGEAYADLDERDDEDERDEDERDRDDGEGDGEKDEDDD